MAPAAPPACNPSPEPPIAPRPPGLPGLTPVLLILLAGLLRPPPAGAQVEFRQVDGSDRGVALLVSGALGAALGAAHAWSRDAPVARGAFLGLLGGTTAHGARWIAATDLPLSGLLARQVGSAGAFLTTEAAGDLALARIPLLFGPFSYHLDERAVTVDGGAAALTLLGLVAGRYDFRGWETLSTGTAVFRTDAGIRVEEQQANGAYLPGNLILRHGSPANTRPHEMVHALQHDYLGATVGAPLQRALLGDRLSVGRGAVRLRLWPVDLVLAAVGSLWSTGDWRHNPLEFEARLMTDGSGPGTPSLTPRAAQSGR